MEAPSPPRITRDTPRAEFFVAFDEALEEDAAEEWWPKNISPRDFIEARRNGMWQMYLAIFDQAHGTRLSLAQQPAGFAHDARESLGGED